MGMLNRKQEKNGTLLDRHGQMAPSGNLFWN